MSYYWPSDRFLSQKTSNAESFCMTWRHLAHTLDPVLIAGTVYPKKYAHGFVVLCFVVVMQSFIMNSHEISIHIHQGCFAGTGAIVRLPQCQWSKPDGYGKTSQCITTPKHNKAKTVCIFLGIYCISIDIRENFILTVIHAFYMIIFFSVIFSLVVSTFSTCNRELLIVMLKRFQQ